MKTDDPDETVSDLADGCAHARGRPVIAAPNPPFLPRLCQPNFLPASPYSSLLTPRPAPALSFRPPQRRDHRPVRCPIRPLPVHPAPGQVRPGAAIPLRRGRHPGWAGVHLRGLGGLRGVRQQDAQHRARDRAAPPRQGATASEGCAATRASPRTRPPPEVPEALTLSSVLCGFLRSFVLVLQVTFYEIDDLGGSDMKEYGLAPYLRPAVGISLRINDWGSPRFGFYDANTSAPVVPPGGEEAVVQWAHDLIAGKVDRDRRSNPVRPSRCPRAHPAEPYPRFSCGFVCRNIAVSTHRVSTPVYPHRYRRCTRMNPSRRLSRETGRTESSTSASSRSC